MIAGAMLQNLFSLVDLFFVGKLGTTAVAALAIAGAVSSIMVLVFMGISTGTTALVAHFIGAKEPENADIVLGQTLVLSTIASLLMVVVGVFGSTPLLELFGATGDVLTSAHDYVRIIFIWSGTIFFFFGISQALRGAGDATTPLKMLVVANLINIALNPLLIMGYWGFPRMEVGGSAVATVISRAVGVALLFGHLFWGHASLHLKLPALKPHASIMKRILSIGVFASMEVLVREISFILLIRLVASFGPVVLAAYGVGTRLRMFTMMPGFGFGTAASVLVGQNLGAGNPDRAAKSVWRTLLFYEITIIPVIIGYLIFATGIANVFLDGSEVIEVAATFLRYLAMTVPFLAVCIIMSRSLGGAGDTKAATLFAGIGMLGVRIPAAYLFSLWMGPEGIWLGINISDVVYAVSVALYFRKRGWIKVHGEHKAALDTSLLELDKSP